MKISIAAILLVSTSDAFQVYQTRIQQTSLQMGFFDFKPMHGSGSGSADNELDEQYRLQQEILKARRDHINFESLHQKYAKDKQDVDVFSLGGKLASDKYQESYVDEEITPSSSTSDKKKGGFKFPWDLKP